MVNIPFIVGDDFTYGKVQTVTPLIRRIVARNPSQFTYFGTGTYIVGHGEVAVIDPGPLLPDHIEAICNALSNETISHILVTHHHADHSPASRPLRKKSGAQIFGRPLISSSDNFDQKVVVEEDYDVKFWPTAVVQHGDVIEGSGWTFECVLTPGHTSNHVCYRLHQEKSLFSGDHVMGWSTSVIIPPDGNMSDYLRSLEMLLGADDLIYYPTHGAPISEPKKFVRKLIEHRIEREQQVVDCFRSGLRTVRQMVPIVYRSTHPSLHGAAALSLFATVIRLVEFGVVECEGNPRMDSEYLFVG